MATRAFIDPALWLDQFDIRGDLNQLTVVTNAALLDATTFGNTARVYRKGLTDTQLSFAGFNQYGTSSVEEILSNDFSASRLLSFAAKRDVGEQGWILTDMQASWDFGGTVGDMDSFRVSSQGKAPLAAGYVLEDGDTARTSTFNGTAVQLGAVAAGETLYGALHVTAASGTTPTLDVIVQSDDAEGMSSPTSRLTFTQATAVTSEQKTAAGAITDDWYRVNVTIGGTGPSFTFAVVIGIA